MARLYIIDIIGLKNIITQDIKHCKDYNKPYTGEQQTEYKDYYLPYDR